MFSFFKQINQFAGKWGALDRVAVFFARYLFYLVIVFLFLIAVFIFRKPEVFFYALFSGVFATFAVARAIYFFYKKKRPAELSDAVVLIPVPKNPSFPSSHATFSFGISFFMLFYDLWIAMIFVSVSLLIGLARVFCGVHWLKDIIGGALAGLFSALIIKYFVNYL